MDLIEGSCNRTHGPDLNKRINKDLLVQHHVEDDRVVFRQTAPCSDNLCVKGHQFGEHVFALCHAKTDENQLSYKGEKIKSEVLACFCAGNFKDLPACIVKSLGLAEASPTTSLLVLSIVLITWSQP